MMRRERARGRAVIRLCVVLLLLVIGVGLAPASATPAMPASRLRMAMHRLGAATVVAPGFGGQLHRLSTRAERSLGRFGATLLQTVLVWSGFVLSAIAFLFVAAVSSAADRRMFDLRRHGLDVLVRDLARGVRTFFGILRDRRTPYLARAILALALLYWLLPVDVIPDGMLMAGVVDDLVVAVVAAKVFIHLCPDAVVLAHASDVEARA